MPTIQVQPFERAPKEDTDFVAEITARLAPTLADDQAEDRAWLTEHMPGAAQDMDDEDRLALVRRNYPELVGGALKMWTFLLQTAIALKDYRVQHGVLPNKEAQGYLTRAKAVFEEIVVWTLATPDKRRSYGSVAIGVVNVGDGEHFFLIVRWGEALRKMPWLPLWRLMEFKHRVRTALESLGRRKLLLCLGIGFILGLIAAVPMISTYDSGRSDSTRTTASQQVPPSASSSSKSQEVVPPPSHPDPYGEYTPSPTDVTSTPPHAYPDDRLTPPSATTNPNHSDDLFIPGDQSADRSDDTNTTAHDEQSSSFGEVIAAIFAVSASVGGVVGATGVVVYMIIGIRSSKDSNRAKQARQFQNTSLYLLFGSAFVLMMISFLSPSTFNIMFHE